MYYELVCDSSKYGGFKKWKVCDGTTITRKRFVSKNRWLIGR